ncbi:NAD(P)/FAD-dependent oxidoreductase [Streptomyces hirsutus]|uniref:NAD(P)/FAD-dependent oxidoreductase n=1 Tax=Streptomyces hirsutus TaxID=35620 RepID=UPI003417EF44
MSQLVEPGKGLDPEELRAAIRGGNIPCLLPVLYQLTGEEKWLKAPYTVARTKGFEELNDGGLPADLQDEIRDAAVEAVLEWDEGKPAAHPAPERAELVRLMTASMGEPIPAQVASMMAEQLGFAPFEPADVSGLIADARPDFSVIVVGAGVSGLAAAIYLKKAGIPFTVLERNEEIGGTWWENTYPGVRVDIPSNLYSYSFFPRNWSENFARRDEIEAYLRDVVRHFGLEEHIRRNTAVEKAEWDDEAGQWVVTIADARSGGRSELRCAALVTAAGLHSSPNIPDFPGLADFQGQVVHSARWTNDTRIAGKKVAVVGTGASAMQAVVAIADDVESMLVLQRSPQWIAPNEHYFEPASKTKHWLFDHVPYYRAWYRFRLYWLYTERIFAALRVDPEREAKGKLVSAMNDAFRRFFTEYLTSRLKGREDLIEKTLPTYPPFGKRMLLDNGWFAALKRPNVELVTAGVERLTSGGLVTTDGEEHEIDTLVLCTGFQQQRFLFPMEIRGRGGVDLRASWDDDNGRAYLGITTPGFPNLFFLYGPNTNPPGGSYIAIAEMQVRYIVELLTRLVTEDLASAECRVEPYERYNEELDAENNRMVYAMDGVDNYYRNAQGRVVTNFPWAVWDYHRHTAHPDLGDFVVTRRT